MWHRIGWSRFRRDGGIGHRSGRDRAGGLLLSGIQRSERGPANLYEGSILVGTDTLTAQLSL